MPPRRGSALGRPLTGHGMPASFKGADDPRDAVRGHMPRISAYPLKVKSKAAVIGLIGAGMIGGTVARLATGAGYYVVLSNSRESPALPG